MATNLDLDVLADLDRATTPAPWHVRHLDDHHAMNAVGIASEPDTDRHEDMATAHGEGPARLAATLIQVPPYVVPPDGRWQEAEPIAALRNALPELLRLARIGALAEAP